MGQHKAILVVFRPFQNTFEPCKIRILNILLPNDVVQKDKETVVVDQGKVPGPKHLLVHELPVGQVVVITDQREQGMLQLGRDVAVPDEFAVDATQREVAHMGDKGQAVLLVEPGHLLFKIVVVGVGISENTDGKRRKRFTALCFQLLHRFQIQVTVGHPHPCLVGTVLKDIVAARCQEQQARHQQSPVKSEYVHKSTRQNKMQN